MKIDKIDQKILREMYHSSREPLTKIAKKTKVSREQIEYRLQKYFKDGLIVKFPTFYNYAKLGFNHFIIAFIKVKNIRYKNKVELKLQSSKNCISYGTTYGKYDFYTSLIFKEELELNRFFEALMENEKIDEHLIIRPYFSELYSLKFLNEKITENEITMIKHENETGKIDATEQKILIALKDNYRMKLIDVAQKADISSELALYKLKKLHTEKIILGSRIQFNMSKLGFYYTIVLIQLKNISKKVIDNMKMFARNNDYINSIIMSISKPNCILQTFHKDEKDLRKTLDEFNEKFRYEIDDIQIIPIDEDKKINSLPFL